MKGTEHYYTRIWLSILHSVTEVKYGFSQAKGETIF
jgi:hypothetical protein